MVNENRKKLIKLLSYVDKINNTDDEVSIPDFNCWLATIMDLYHECGYDVSISDFMASEIFKNRSHADDRKEMISLYMNEFFHDLKDFPRLKIDGDDENIFNYDDMPNALEDKYNKLIFDYYNDRELPKGFKLPYVLDALAKINEKFGISTKEIYGVKEDSTLEKVKVEEVKFLETPVEVVSEEVLCNILTSNGFSKFDEVKKNRMIKSLFEIVSLIIKFKYVDQFNIYLNGLNGTVYRGLCEKSNDLNQKYLDLYNKFQELNKKDKSSRLFSMINYLKQTKPIVKRLDEMEKELAVVRECKISFLQKFYDTNEIKRIFDYIGIDLGPDSDKLYGIFDFDNLTSILDKINMMDNFKEYGIVLNNENIDRVSQACLKYIKPDSVSRERKKE